MVSMLVEPMVVADVEDEWAAWNSRCLVSHAAGNFIRYRLDHVAFHRLVKPLHQVRVALASSGGVHCAHQVPFDMQSHAGDDSVRWIPWDTTARALRFAHDHYDHTAADNDPNCMFPLERLRDLARAAVIGSVAAEHVGFMGFIPNPSCFLSDVVPEVVARLRRDQVDAVVLSPG
jgi:D-proline reductase (dithiol) PrdB